MKNWKRNIKTAFWVLVAGLLLWEALSAYRTLANPYRAPRPTRQPSKEWRTVGRIFRWLLVATPVVLLLRWVIAQCYRAWLAWRHDRIELDARQVQALALARREQLVHLRPDEHGFGGVVHDQRTGIFHDLDTSESWPRDRIANADPERVTGRVKQGWLAALSGSTFRQRFVQETIQGGEEEKPQLQIAEGEGWLTLEAKADGGEVEV